MDGVEGTVHGRGEKAVALVNSFGPLLKERRGTIPLREVGRRAGLSYSYLAKVEAGHKVLREERAREVLRRGLGLGEGEVEGLLLEARLLDCGLSDEGLRHLVIDVIRQEVPARVREELRRLSRSYRRKSLPSTPRPRRTGSS